MANLDFQNLAVHAYKDLETGLLHVVADIEGALVPLVTHKLGTLAQAQQVAKAQQGQQGS